MKQLKHWRSQGTHGRHRATPAPPAITPNQHAMCGRSDRPEYTTRKHHRSPDLLSEEEVRSYLLGLRQQGVARGTFRTSHYGLRFFYQHTLGRTWELFGGKKDRLATSEAAAS